MIDIHTHVLPGIDDGSKDLEETAKMFEIMVSSGVDKIVATPHFYNTISIDEFLEKRSKAYNSILNLPLKPDVVLGAEVLLEYGLHERADLRKLCIQNTDYMLVELPYARWDGWIFDELFKISAKHDIDIIIAHIDRYSSFADTEDIYKLYDMNMKFQVNIDRLGGIFKRSSSVKFMKNDMADFIASDCHNTAERRPCLADAVKKLTSMFGSKYVSGLMKNAENMLSGI